MKSSREELTRALQGNWKREHLFCLKQALSCYDFAVEQMRLCELEIERSLDEINGGDGSGHLDKNIKTRQNEYSFKAESYLNSIAGTNLTAIDGLEEKSLVTIFSEVGTDLSKWPTASHFSAWLGLSPRPKKRGIKHVAATRVRYPAVREKHSSLRRQACIIAKATWVHSTAGLPIAKAVLRQ